MMYYGKNVRLSYYDHPDFRDEIKVYQQHCGGENLCVYKGKLLEKGTPIKYEKDLIHILNMNWKYGTKTSPMNFE